MTAPKNVKFARSIAAAASVSKAFFAVLISGSVVGCASARMSDSASDHLFRSGQYEAAAAKLREGVKDQGENGRDLLLYLLDLGLTLHTAGLYEESNKAFEQAEKIAEIKDYTSLSAEGATLLLSENLKDYKGEDFEKILINTYKAMNYALMGGTDDAIVEARLVNRKLHMMVTDGQRKYKQSAFARYLSAILYESEGEYSDAYIDYKNTYDLEPGFPGLGRDLWRLAWLQGDSDRMDEWAEKFSLTDEDKSAARELKPSKGKGEIVVIYENGISPIKKPNRNFESTPMFYPRYNPVRLANVEINGEVRASTAVLDDIEAVAIENLEEKYGGIVAKKIAGLAVKGGIAYGVARATDNPMLGYLAGMLLVKADQADLRSWNLLPRDLQIARVTVAPGTYSVRVVPLGAGVLPEKSVVVGAGKKVILDFRYTPS